MEQIVQQIEQYKQEMLAFEAQTPEQVEAFRIKYLGTKGLVKAIMGEMKNVPVDQKKAFGQTLNEFKEFAEGRYAFLKEQAGEQTDSAASSKDISLPGDL
ncbi:MAG: phenylalanine--tRNA ligase subunit alpha, partial [Sediminibacterium sp.]